MRGPSTFEDLVAVINVCYEVALGDDDFSDVELDAIINGLRAQYNFTGKDELLQTYIEAAAKMSLDEATDRIKRFGREEKQFTSDMLYKVVLSDGKLDRDEDYTYWDVIDECGLPTPTSR